jgi:hypothetical protein
VKYGAFTRIADGPYLEDFRSCSLAKATFHNINPIKFRKLMFGAQNKLVACENDSLSLAKTLTSAVSKAETLKPCLLPIALILFPGFKPTGTGVTA